MPPSVCACAPAAAGAVGGGILEIVDSNLRLDSGWEKSKDTQPGKITRDFSTLSRPLEGRGPRNPASQSSFTCHKHGCMRLRDDVTVKWPN
jgi:hypothetical protein